MEPQYKLSALLGIVENGFKDYFDGFAFWGFSEIIKVSVKGKYTYLEMVEYDEEGKVKAKATGCIFDEGVCRRFLQDTKLKSVQEMVGLKILFYGKFSFHREYHFSIIIHELSAEYALGQLQKKQDEILMKLQQLGILYKNKQTAWGYPPYTIAVISAENAAGLTDFQSVLQQSEYDVRIQYHYCAMHGNNAIEAVQGELQKIYTSMVGGERISGVAIIRGGGESSGMNRQNDFHIAQSICLMPVPVIVAVGHTNDKTILQELAHYAAKTPTDAAYHISHMLDSWDANISLLYTTILSVCAERYSKLRMYIDQRHMTIGLKLTQFLQHARLSIDGRYNTIMAVSPQKMLQSGYALLMQQGELLDKKQIGALDVGDDLDIQVYDQEFTVKITRKK